MKIAVDAMGGDYAPSAVVEGAVLALRDYKDIQELFLVGDAGRHVSALHGGGIWFARVAGQEAGRVIAHQGTDAHYEKAWKARIGFTLKAHYAGKRVLYDFDDQALDIVVGELGKHKPQSADPTREIMRAAKVLSRHPVLAAKASVAAFKAAVGR